MWECGSREEEETKTNICITNERLIDNSLANIYGL